MFIVFVNLNFFSFQIASYSGFLDLERPTIYAAITMTTRAARIDPTMMGMIGLKSSLAQSSARGQWKIVWV